MCAKVTAMMARILLTANDEQFPIARDWHAIDDDVCCMNDFFCGCFGVDASTPRDSISAPARR
jgi:hypothetical protein